MRQNSKIKNTKLSDNVNNIKQKLKEIITDRNLYLFLLITIIFFGMFIKLEYALDTYCVFAGDTKDYCMHFLYSGRPISALFLAITRLLGFGPNGIYLTSFIIAIISTVASMYILFNTIKKDLKNELIGKIISILIVLNIFSIELYLFLEKGIMMLSVLFCVLAFKQFVNYLKKEKTKYIVYTFIFMIFANFSYQGTVGLFVALACVYIAYIVKNNNNLKIFIKNNILAAICYGIPALINYLIIKFIFNNARVNSAFDIVQSIKLILYNSFTMVIQTYSLIPKYVFLITLCIMLLFLVITIFTKKENGKNKAILVLKVIYIILATYVVTVLPQILQSTDSIWFAPRSTYTFASLIGIMALYTFLLQGDSKKRIMIYTSVIVLVLYLAFQYVGFMKIERNRYIINYIDYYNAMQIQEKVYNYEKSTGNIITKVAIYEQDGSSKIYPDLYTSGDINYKATMAEWSRIDYLGYYLERKLNYTETDENIYNEYFKNKNWSIFDTDQVVLIGDTLHFYLY